ncbi:hypothetical protein ACWD62_16225 [Streptomyces sp. NPDC005146]
MSQTLVESGAAARSRRWLRLTTLAAEQALISASAYAVTWTFVHMAGNEQLPGFYICWLWGWGLFTVLSQLILAPARVMRADRELSDQELSAVMLSACWGSGAAVAVTVVASLLGLDPMASVASAVGLALAALAFFTRRLQVDENPWGILPRAACYLALAVAGCYSLAEAGLFTQVTAVAWASITLIATAVWGTPGRPFHGATSAALLLRQVWPQGRWYAAVTVTRTVLYSSGLITLIHMRHGAKETAVVAAILVLVGPLTVIGSVFPWAHLPELRPALKDRDLFVRIWTRQLMLYLAVLAVTSAGISVAWTPWVRMSAKGTGLAAAVSSERPAVLVLVAATLLTSWTSTALLALDKAKLTFGVVCVSGALALSSVALGISAKVSVILPYVSTVVLGCGAVLGVLRSSGGRSR